MERKIAMIAVAVVCVGAFAVAGMFLPSQTPQRIEENKAWQFKQDFYGISDENIWIDIGADVWRVTWYAFPVENLYNGIPWPVPYSYFGMHIYAYPENTLAARGYSSEGVPLSGVDYIIRGGQFYIEVFTRDIDYWQIFVYELK